MKRLLNWVWSLSLTLLLTACWQKSLEAFYTEADVIFDAALNGTWVDSEAEPGKQESEWIFSRGPGEKRYRLTIVDGEFTGEFEARLFRFAGSTFLDLYSRKREISEIPVHHLLKVELKADTLEVRIMSLEWMKNWLQLHPKSLAHIRLNDPDDPENTDSKEFVLTARTAELQQFLRQHLNDDGFFDDPGVLKRTNKLASR